MTDSVPPAAPAPLDTLRKAVLALDSEAQDHDGTMRRFCQICGWHDGEHDHEPECPVPIAALSGANEETKP